MATKKCAGLKGKEMIVCLKQRPQSRSEQVAKEIVSFTQRSGTAKSIEFAIEEIERHYIEKGG